MMLKNKLILPAVALLAGVVNGFIGTGGGIILYFTLKLLRKPDQPDQSNPDAADGKMKDILATVVACVIPVSAVSAVVYMLRGNIIYSALAVYVPAAFIGGLVGALLLEKLKFRIVKKIFAALIIYAGVRMLLP